MVVRCFRLKRGKPTNMVNFGCTTCWKIKDDKEIKYWDDKPVCERCYDKYNRHAIQKYGY